jgi:hypothetical protein
MDICQMPTTGRLGTDFGLRIDDFRWQVRRTSLVVAVFTDRYGQPELTVNHTRDIGHTGGATTSSKVRYAVHRRD